MTLESPSDLLTVREAVMVNKPIPALPLRSCAASGLQSCLRIFSPVLKSLRKEEFRKLSDILRNSIRSQKAFGYPYGVKLVPDSFPETIRRLSDSFLNSESFLVSFAS